MREPTEACKECSARAPVRTSGEEAIHRRLPGVLRPSARESLGGGGNPRKVAGGAPPSLPGKASGGGGILGGCKRCSSLAPVRASAEDGNQRRQEVLRPSAREGLGGRGQSTGGWNCSALAPVRASGRDGSLGRLRGEPHLVYVRTSKAGAVHGKRPGLLGQGEHCSTSKAGLLERLRGAPGHPFLAKGDPFPGKEALPAGRKEGPGWGGRAIGQWNWALWDGPGAASSLGTQDRELRAALLLWVE